MKLIYAFRYLALDDRYHGLIGRYGPPGVAPIAFRTFLAALVAGVACRGKIYSDVGASLKSAQGALPIIITHRFSVWPDYDPFCAK